MDIQPIRVALPASEPYQLPNSNALQLIPINLEPLERAEIADTIQSVHCGEDYITNLLDQCMTLSENISLDFGNVQKDLQKEIKSIKAEIPPTRNDNLDKKNYYLAITKSNSCIKKQLENKLIFANQILTNINKDMQLLDLDFVQNLVSMFR